MEKLLMPIRDDANQYIEEAPISELESGKGRLEMTKEELILSKSRFTQMINHYFQLLSSDPGNTAYYMILMDHSRRQSWALSRRLQELEQEA